MPFERLVAGGDRRYLRHFEPEAKSICQAQASMKQMGVSENCGYLIRGVLIIRILLFRVL